MARLLRPRFGRDKAPDPRIGLRVAIIAQDVPDFHGDNVIDACSRYMLFSTVIVILCVIYVQHIPKCLGK